MPLPASYEEVRGAAISLIRLFSTQTSPTVRQWNNLKIHLGQELAAPGSIRLGTGQKLAPTSDHDAETLREVFWSLFRQGFITLGISEYDAGWPFYSISRFGRSAFALEEPYRFTDTTSYLNAVRRDIPSLDEVSARYLDEAMQSFHSGCLLAANVMLGVAAECRFNIMLEAIAASGREAARFKPVLQKKAALHRIKAFRFALAPLTSDLPNAIGDDISARLDPIQAIIRIARNEAGHPTGLVPDRENTFVNLRLFIPFGQVLARLQDHLTSL